MNAFSQVTEKLTNKISSLFEKIAGGGGAGPQQANDLEYDLDDLHNSFDDSHLLRNDQRPRNIHRPHSTLITNNDNGFRTAYPKPTAASMGLSGSAAKLYMMSGRPPLFSQKKNHERGHIES